MKRGALLLAALLAAPLLFVPGVAAAPPLATAGSPHDPVADVVAVAIADAGSSAAAVMGAPFFRGSGPTDTKCAPTDFQVYNFPEGATYAGTYQSGAPSANGCREPLGRSHVAINRDGNVVVTLGRDRLTPAQGLTPVLELSYHRVAPGATWNGTDAPQKLEIVLPGTATGLLVSESGERIVVAGNDGDRHYVRGYTYAGTALNLAFNYGAAGNATSIAGTPDLATVVVGSHAAEGSLVRGVVTLIPFNQGRATFSYYDRSADNTTVPAVAISPDGSRFVAGSVEGRLHAFDNRGSLTPDPTPVTVAGAGNVTRLVVSGDGSRLAAVAGRDLVHYDYRSPTPGVVWNYTAQGDGFTDLAYNRTGGVLLAGVVGLGAVGFGEANATPFWTLPGANTFVDINADATRAIVAQRTSGTATTVSLYDLPRAITFQYPNGADVDQPRTAAPGAPAVYEMDLINEGAAPERIRFELSDNAGEMVLETVPADPIVNPGQTQRVVLKIAPTRAVPGDTTFNVTAIATGSGARDDATVTVRQPARVSVTLAYDGPTDLSIQPTDVTTLLLGVENDGNKDTAVGIKATQSVNEGASWNITIDPQSFTLSPGKKTTVRATITPPPGVANGTANTVTLSLEGQDVAGSATVTLRVNPRVGVALAADSMARFVTVGGEVVYNLTLRNNGTLPREYEVYHEVRNAGSSSWFADVDEGPYLLAPGANKTFQVRVFAPNDIEAEDRATIVVFARTIPQLGDETSVTTNATLYAIAVQPPTPTPTDEGSNVPAPAAVFSLTALLLAAVALRRRNSR